MTAETPSSEVVDPVQRYLDDFAQPSPSSRRELAFDRDLEGTEVALGAPNGAPRVP
jgi:hypothetical protein